MEIEPLDRYLFNKKALSLYSSIVRIELAAIVEFWDCAVTASRQPDVLAEAVTVLADVTGDCIITSHLTPHSSRLSITHINARVIHSWKLIIFKNIE